MSHTGVVFDTFESIKYSKNEIEQAELRYTKGSTDNSNDEYMGIQSIIKSTSYHTYSLTHSLTHSPTHPLTHSLNTHQ